MHKEFDVAVDVGPAILKSSLKVGAVSGSLGGVVGTVAGLFRGTNPLIFGIASGLQCFSIGSSYWAVKQGQLAYLSTNGKAVTPHDRVIGSAIAGGASGAFVASLFRGRRNVIPGIVVFSAFGYLGQSVYNRLQQQHAERDPSEKKIPFLQRIAQSRYTPVKMLSNEEYEDMLEQKVLRIDAEIALIDEDIARLKIEESNSNSPEQI